MKKKQSVIRLTITFFLLFIFGLFSFGHLILGKPSAIDLSDKKRSLVFIILTHVRDEKDQLLHERCYHSVKAFYPDAPIVIIDDNSTIPVSKKAFPDAKIIRSEYPGAGEILPYTYFLKERWAEKMVFLHDSMFLKRPFYQEELNNSVCFHWYFEFHNYDDDDMINHLLSHLHDSKKLIDYNTYHKASWLGCFGCATIIDLTVLDQIENKYSLTGRLKKIIKTRAQRCAFERVLGVILFKEKYVNKEKCSNFGSIRFYPLAFEEVDSVTLEKIKSGYSGAILKTWHGR